MTVSEVLDAAGRRRSPATMPGYHAGRPPRNKGQLYPADPPTTARLELPLEPLFCVIDGPTRGRPWSSANVRVEFRRLAAQAGIRRRFAPHQLRHTHAVELAREGVPLNVIQRQLGHANPGATSIYLQGIDTAEIIASVHARRAPMMSATAGLQL
jgi:integrase